MTQARVAPQAPAPTRRPTLGIASKPKATPRQAFVGEPAIVVVPSAPITYPIKRLRRASENVRHIRIDEDCNTLADGIQSHGLLQSLIGYELDGYIEIVDGGRRLKALRIVRDRGHITDDFLVPVLIRGIEEAVELSLDANIQHRTMSPVDEFRAFAMLMDRGDTSAAGLAKRFGLSESVVRQRLRLAKLAQPILDALADREITLDAAMAYATAQEQVLQLQVFEHQAKRGHRGHEPSAVRHSLRMKGIDTADRLFRFVGADRYEREGGGYEDDLLDEVGADRVLDKPFVVETIANALVDEQVPALIEQLQRDPAWAPTIAGFVKVPDLRLHHDGTQQELRAPLGYVRMTDTDSDKLWATIRGASLPAHVVVGLDVASELIADPRYAFVPIAQKAAIEKPALAARAADTAREAASRREADILRYARRFAVPPFAGTALEGRVTWFPAENDRHYPATLNGVDGFKLPAFIFVPAADVGPAQRRQAAKHVDQLIAAREQEKGSRA